ncbi:hypothetical protein Syun_020481 [Stephania yunnanensis]|uniref:GST N-terminal domain-containing protein n=1 Tax=Stephania yunnanensis TaxID=152371 RepID=A0AAP0IDV4_9MAGN
MQHCGGGFVFASLRRFRVSHVAFPCLANARGEYGAGTPVEAWGLIEFRVKYDDVLATQSRIVSTIPGEARLYMAYTCPFAQRAWITRNYKGLQDKIQLVPIDLWKRPAWYKEKVYPENKVLL